jgi:hypothetical protein
MKYIIKQNRWIHYRGVTCRWQINYKYKNRRSLFW